MSKIKSAIVTLSILSGYCCFAQTNPTTRGISKLDSAYQICLDKGENMPGCSERYYSQMDSMLNVVYNLLRIRSDTAGRKHLKAEQKEWLSNRDEYFNSLPDNEKDLQGEDKEMDIADKKAGYVRKRVLELLGRIHY
jgi:uncharacterized protein YecT (DUF1311 family)